MTVELRVLSYNLLAPLFVRVPGQSYSDFGHAAAEHLDWTRREPMIAPGGSTTTGSTARPRTRPRRCERRKRVIVTE